MFDQYFDDLETSRVLRARVETLYQAYTRLIDPARVPHIFIANTIGEDGTRSWGSLWIYGPGFAGEVKNFQTETKFDGFNFNRSPLTRWECTLENFEIGGTASTDSRFHLNWNSESISANMPSTGVNCSQLTHFFESVILPIDAA